MTDLTIPIPDELMERLRPHLDELPRVLELGVAELEKSAVSDATFHHEHIRRLLVEKGIARPLDKNLLPPGVLEAPRQPPLAIPGKPVSEIIIEMRGPR